MPVQYNHNRQTRKALKGLISSAQGAALGKRSEKNLNPERVSLWSDTGFSENEFNPCRVDFNGVAETQGVALGSGMATPVWGCLILLEQQ